MTADSTKTEILYTSTDFTIKESTDRWITIPWDSVAEISAFKRDLFAYDEVCLGFRLADTNSFLTISEDSIGWEAFLAELPKHYPAIHLKSLQDIAFPAFAQNWTSIWPQ